MIWSFAPGLWEGMYLHGNGAPSRLGGLQFAKFYSKFTDGDVDLVLVLFLHKRVDEPLAESFVSFSHRQNFIIFFEEVTQFLSLIW